MQEYQIVSIILCVYGIFKEFRPSEPYLVPLMTEPPLNFTSQQVTQLDYLSIVGLRVIVIMRTDSMLIIVIKLF